MKYSYNDFISSFTDAKERAADLIQHFPEQKLNTKPMEKKWSALEILSHLIQTGNKYKEQLETLFKSGIEDMPQGSEPFEPNLFMRWFISQVSPQNTRPLPTVKPFEPLAHEILDKDILLKDFLLLQDFAIKTVTECKDNGLDMDEISIRNPIVKIVPMSLTACFGVMSAHQKRHFGQIEALSKKFSSPA
ncbi:DinB family protein [Balneola sp. MJW-20]|uniref:DinB family protein n=1 Tax=Gracilimonas aurantiaca TaxID=3234185 RepID=UPI00346675AB